MLLRHAEKPDDPRIYSALGIVYAGLHRNDLAIEMGRKAVDLMPVSKEAVAGSYFNKSLAVVYVMTGRYREALELISYLLSIPGGVTTTMLEIDPVWAPLKAYPEFGRLIRHK